MRKRNGFRVRLAVMFAVLAIAAVGYFTSAGIGNLSGFGFGSITLLCPLGALLAMLAEKTLIPLAAISVIAVLIVCIVLGKVFCSWVCPVHFMAGLKRKGKHPKRSGDDSSEHGAEPKNVAAVGGCSACKTPCGKAKGIRIDSRHGILAAALGSTLVFGFPVFCLVCPVGLTFATVLLGMRLFAFGETTWTIVAFIAIIVIEIVFLPKWCQRFCPLGALLSLFSAPNKAFRPQVDASTCLKESRGKACSLCEKVCPEGINLHDIAAGATTLNDCSKCRACADACPERSITFPLIPSKHLRLGSAVAVEEGSGACAAAAVSEPSDGTRVGGHGMDGAVEAVAKKVSSANGKG